MIQYGFLPTLVVNGFFLGVGTGVPYAVALKYAQLWYPTHNGIIVGVVMAGFGLGTFGANFMQSGIINPHNLAPDFEFNGEK